MDVECISDSEQARDCEKGTHLLFRHMCNVKKTHFTEQSFELCRARDFNLSYACLTSPEARRKLRDLKNIDPEFWGQLTGTIASTPANDDGAAAEDENNADFLFEDDSDLPCDALVANMLGSNIARVTVTDNGDLVSTAMAESLREGTETVATPSTEAEGSGQRVSNPQPSDTGRGKRKRVQNRMYKSFWRHNDDDPSDAEDGN